MAEPARIRLHALCRLAAQSGRDTPAVPSILADRMIEVINTRPDKDELLAELAHVGAQAMLGGPVQVPSRVNVLLGRTAR